MNEGIDRSKRYPVAVTEGKRVREVSPALDELRLVGPAGVAELMGISKRQISRWLSDGTLPAYDFAKGQTKRWRLTTIRAWIEGQQTKAS